MTEEKEEQEEEEESGFLGVGYRCVTSNPLVNEGILSNTLQLLY